MHYFKHTNLTKKTFMPSSGMNVAVNVFAVFLSKKQHILVNENIFRNLLFNGSYDAVNLSRFYPITNGC